MQGTAEKVCASLLHSLQSDNQLSVRYLMEWIAVALVTRFPVLLERQVYQLLEQVCTACRAFAAVLVRNFLIWKLVYYSSASGRGRLQLLHALTRDGFKEGSFLTFACKFYAKSCNHGEIASSAPFMTSWPSIQQYASGAKLSQLGCSWLAVGSEELS